MGWDGMGLRPSKGSRCENVERAAALDKRGGGGRRDGWIERTNERECVCVCTCENRAQVESVMRAIGFSSLGIPVLNLPT